MRIHSVFITPPLFLRENRQSPTSIHHSALMAGRLLCCGAHMGSTSSSASKHGTQPDIAQRLGGGDAGAASLQEAAPKAPVEPDPSSNGAPQRLGLKQLLASHQDALLEDERQFLTDAAALLKVSPLCLWHA